MTLEQIIKALADRRLSVVAKGTGLTRETLRRIRDGHSANPTYDTMQRLIAYFEAAK
jgi:DNA-binding phage protein